MTPAQLEDALRDYILALPAAQAQGLTALDRSDDLIEQGVFDSISLLEFILYLEQSLGVKIPGEDVDPDNFGSLAAISRYLHTQYGLA
jgi:acyl carrier protein